MDTFLLQFPYLPTFLLQFLHFIYFLQFSSVHQHLLFYFFGHLCCWLLLMCHSFLQSYSSSYITYISYSSVHFISILFLYLYFFSPPPHLFCLLFYFFVHLCWAVGFRKYRKTVIILFHPLQNLIEAAPADHIKFNLVRGMLPSSSIWYSSSVLLLVFLVSLLYGLHLVFVLVYCWVERSNRQ